MQKRITEEKKEEGVLIKIKAFKDESKQKNLTVWLLFWTFCGAAIGSQLFVEANKELHTFIYVYLAFWAYFEFMVVKAFRWRRKGEEQLLITNSNVHYGRTFANRGFLKPYRKDLVNAARLLDEQSNTFVKTFASSYWVIGGERLSFTVNGKVIPFGLRLSDKEAKQLMKRLNDLLA